MASYVICGVRSQGLESGTHLWGNYCAYQHRREFVDVGFLWAKWKTLETTRDIWGRCNFVPFTLKKWECKIWFFTSIMILLNSKDCLNLSKLGCSFLAFWYDLNQFKVFFLFGYSLLFYKNTSGHSINFSHNNKFLNS